MTIPNIRMRGQQLTIRLSFAALAIVCVLHVATRAYAAPSEERTLRMFNVNTKESISVVYKRNGAYVPEALTKLDHIMRDWRRDITIKIDPELYDIIWETHRELGSQVPVHLISGHRSAASNEGLRRSRGGQARGSLHITGKAADIQFPDISLKQLRNSALIKERGGVGYYPTSAVPFVHVDTGRVRHWPRIQRMDLAVLFPSGHSKHVPADGRPLTQRDFRVALASYQGNHSDLPPSLQRKLRLGAPVAVASAEPETPAAQPAVLTGKPNFLKPTYASLTSFGGSRAAPQAPNKPVVLGGTQLTSARPDANEFAREVMGQPVAQEEPEYDDDEIADDLEYQPYPALSYMGDMPVAYMDMTAPADALTPAKVMLMIGEAREMLHQQFAPGIPAANLALAQRFRGSAVNTALRRVDRDGRQGAVKTAQAAR